MKVIEEKDQLEKKVKLGPQFSPPNPFIIQTDRCLGYAGRFTLKQLQQGFKSNDQFNFEGIVLSLAKKGSQIKHPPSQE